MPIGMVLEPEKQKAVVRVRDAMADILRSAFADDKVFSSTAELIALAARKAIELRADLRKLVAG